MGKLSENSEISGVGLQFQIQKKFESILKNKSNFYFPGDFFHLFLHFCISSLLKFYCGGFVAWKLCFSEFSQCLLFSHQTLDQYL